MARQEIKNPMDDNALNNTNHNFIELYKGVQDASGKINKVEKELNNKINDFINTLSEDAFNKVIDDIRLNWSHVVDNFADLPTNPKKGETVAVENDNMIYRYDGSNWIAFMPFTQFSAIAEVDSRLSSQLAETDDFRRTESMVSRKQTRKPMLTITDDDGWSGVYTILFKLAKEYNVPFTSAMITSRPMGFPGDSRPYNNRYVHYNEWIEMRDSGLIEIVSHTHEHQLDKKLTEVSLEDLHTDLRTSNEFMKKYNFNHRGVIFPYGAYDERVLEAASRYYDYSTGSGTSRDSDKRIVSAKSGVNNYRLGRFNLNKPFEENKKMLDKTIEENGWLIMIGHIEQEPATEQDYRNIIEYALNNGIEIVTLEEGYRTFGNIAQFGGTRMKPSITISGEGGIYGDNLGINIIDRSKYTANDTPLEDFEQNKITHSIIRESQLEGFPGYGTSGILTTHYFSPIEDFWNYQTFYTTREKEYYYRYYTSNGWTDWTPVNDYRVTPLNSFHGGNRIEDFYLGTTVFRVQSSFNNEGLPNGVGGTFTTTKVSDIENMWNYQEFVEYGSHKKYIRYAKSNGDWSEWKQFVLE